MRRVVIGRFGGRICVVKLPFMVSEAVWCVEKFGPDHGWIVVELTI